MARNKTAQGGISLRRKVTAWLAAILLVTMLSTGIATMAGQWTVRSFDMLLADNAVCYTVQNALKDETQAFARYVRQPTSETEQAYTAACTAKGKGWSDDKRITDTGLISKVYSVLNSINDL